MKVSVEISLYPLANDYIPPIKRFIERLNGYSTLRVITNTMSTQVFGEYGTVMQVLGEEMQTLHREVPKACFVMKVLGSDLDPALQA